MIELLEGQLSLLDLGPASKPQEATFPAWYTPSKVRKTANMRVLQGRHPMGMRLAEEGTCGSCKNILQTGTRAGGRYLKCDLVPMTHGPATDIRAKWLACEKWESQ